MVLENHFRTKANRTKANRQMFTGQMLTVDNKNSHRQKRTHTKAGVDNGSHGQKLTETRAHRNKSSHGQKPTLTKVHIKERVTQLTIVWGETSAYIPHQVQLKRIYNYVTQI